MRSHIVRATLFGLGVIGLVLAAHGQAVAGVTIPAPEIDATSLSSGLGLLAAGILIVRSRLRLKK